MRVSTPRARQRCQPSQREAIVELWPHQSSEWALDRTYEWFDGAVSGDLRWQPYETAALPCMHLKCDGGTDDGLNLWAAIELEHSPPRARTQWTGALVVANRKRARTHAEFDGHQLDGHQRVRGA